MNAGAKRVAAAIAVALACGGCAATPHADPAPVPDNAVQVGEDLYMVPLPGRIGGCQAYRQASRTRMVTAALYYRGRDGGFVLDRNKAVCD